MAAAEKRMRQPYMAATETQKRADRDGCDGNTKRGRQGWLRWRNTKKRKHNIYKS